LTSALLNKPQTFPQICNLRIITIIMESSSFLFLINFELEFASSETSASVPVLEASNSYILFGSYYHKEALIGLVVLRLPSKVLARNLPCPPLPLLSHSNPPHTGSQIVSEARAIILAGGTLQPTSELRERLFPQVPDARLHFFSCGHIVPRESVLPIAVRQGPTGRQFDFRFESRSAPPMVGFFSSG
jgi:hypothetical protein